jgi:hypothetical protein
MRRATVGTLAFLTGLAMLVGCGDEDGGTTVVEKEYQAGDGLALDSGTTPPTFSVDFAGGGTVATASRSDHGHDAYYYTETEVDAALVGKADAVHTHDYVDLTGDTMQGVLTLAADPAGAMEAATKQYVDAATAGGSIASIDGVANAGGDVDLVPGAGIVITPDDGADTVTIAADVGVNDGQLVQVGASGTLPALDGGLLTGIVATDSDMVDGLHAAAFALGAHAHSSLVDSSATPVERVFVDTAGNVGVGIATPLEKLSVAGVIQTTSGGVKFPDATIQTTAAVNQSPVPLLRAMPGSGHFPWGVRDFDAGESYDPEGTATLQYAWDFVGRGEFGTPGPSATITHGFDEGVHLVGVRVNDGLRVAESKVLVCIEGDPHVVDEGPLGQVGAGSSLGVVNGMPAISYYDTTMSALRYVRALSAYGSSWYTSVLVDNAGDVGAQLSLCVVAGQPAIAYSDFTNWDLKYVRAADALGSSWGAPVSVDVVGMVGLSATLCIVDGRPAISYYDHTNGDLKYVRAADAQGSSWGTPAVVDATGVVGQHSSMCLVNGSPAISYWDETNNDLKYARALNAQGSSWGTPVSVDTAGSVGWYSSLCVVDGRPAISYYDSTNGDLKYVWAADAQGSSWETLVPVDTSGDVGQYTTLQVIDSRPAISYYDATNGDLKYVISP